MPDIHLFNYRAMATHFQVRIADQERGYAQQAAQASFDLLDMLEARLSRFRASSDIAQIAQLAAGEAMVLSEPTFACLEIAKRMELVTSGGFSPTCSALQTHSSMPRWDLIPEDLSIVCRSGTLQFDLGAIGKGFALDRMAELLRQWDCPAFLLVAGGSSVLASDPPGAEPGWSCGLGNDDAPHRLLLAHASLSGSGLAVKGNHILDPRTGQFAFRQSRAWAVAATAAESDALSTACMVLSESDMADVLAYSHSWLALLETDQGIRSIGDRPLPIRP